MKSIPFNTANRTLTELGGGVSRGWRETKGNFPWFIFRGTPRFLLPPASHIARAPGTSGSKPGDQGANRVCLPKKRPERPREYSRGTISAHSQTTSSQYSWKWTGVLFKILLVPSISILSRDPDLSRKRPETRGKRLVFETNDGWKEWRRSQPLEIHTVHFSTPKKGIPKTGR